MLVAAAVCPCPPLLVPEVAAGAAPELDGLRAACDTALGALQRADADVWWVVGPSDELRAYPAGCRGGFAPFGVARDVVLGEGPGSAAPLPASLAVGAWLLERAGTHPDVRALTVPEDLDPARCAAEGARLAGSAARVALLALGDGSACRSVKAPGYLDDRAEPFDAGVAQALADPSEAARVARLARLDPGLAAELQASGRAVWQLLAGAARGAGLDSVLRYADAPYGVGYLVAEWA